MHFLTVDELNRIIPGISDITELTEAGQKIVYKAKSQQYGTIVLKIIKTSNERTKREIDIASRGSFPNVPGLYTWGTLQHNNSEITYLVEQFISGQTLRDYLNQYRTLSFSMSLALLKSLLETAVELEKQRLVHRDIKPENIMIDDNGSFWVLDFGIARHLDESSITATNNPFGPATWGYAAPEQIRNMKKQIDIRADLFSIGVLMYEVLSGQHPFLNNARDQFDVLRRTEGFKPKPLTVQGDPSNQLSQLISVLMEKYPSRRPQSAKMALDMYNKIFTTIAKE